MPGANTVVKRLTSRAEFEQFARFPYEVYADRQAWWQPDVQNEIALLSGASALSAHIHLVPFAAYVAGRMAARVSAVINFRYNEHWGERLGHLIHFEALAHHDEATRMLLDAACAWLGERAMKAARSGFAPFLDYPYAIDNYGELPSFLLRGNPGYYHCYLKNAEFETEKAQVDYTAALTPQTVECYESFVRNATAAGFVLKSWREFGYFAAVDCWTDVTNAAFDRHWGWHPVSRTEVRAIMASLSDTPIADLSMLALRRGEPVGAVFSVPDLTTLLARLQPGAKLAPERGGGTRGALVNIGVLEAMRGRGVALAMAAQSFLRMARMGMRHAGYTLVLDDNWPSRHTAERLEARVTANFVTYRRTL